MVRPSAAARLTLSRAVASFGHFKRVTCSRHCPLGDNLFLARRGGSWPSPFRHAAALPLPPQAFRVLELSGLKTRLGERAAALGHGERKWLELCMVLAAEPAVIFLDEPTAGLSPADRLRTGEVLLALVREHGIGLLLI